MLTESVMLSVAGGALAVPVSYAVLQVVARLNPGDVPRFEETTLDTRVLLFGLSVALATGLIAGIFPAVSASFVNVGELLRQGGRGIAGVSWRVRNTLIVSEIALAVVLLAGAGLLIRSYLVIQGEDKGFASSTLTMSVVLDQQDGKLGPTASRELMNRIQAVPGWLKTVVVSKSFAKHYFPGRDAVGHRVRVNDSRWSTIAGVVGDVRNSSLEEAPPPTVYSQGGVADSVVIRTIGPPDAIISSIRRAVSALNAGVTLTDIQTMNQYVDQASARRRFQTVVLTSFAGVAVLLALVGLYGLVSYAVMQRTAEIGVRMTMGASRGSVVGMVALYGLKLTSAGLVIGVCLALAFTRAVASFLYGVRAVDPMTFIAVAALIIGVAVIACIAPAWRAAGIDPVSALRRQ